MPRASPTDRSSPVRIEQKGKADVVLNNVLAFGGYDAVMLFAREGILPANVGER